METTAKEKKKLREAKSSFKAIKKQHPSLYNDLRDDVIRTFVMTKAPDWGSLRFTITPKGV